MDYHSEKNKMEITFVTPDFETLGIGYLMAICKSKGYEVDFIFYHMEERI